MSLERKFSLLVTNPRKGNFLLYIINNRRIKIRLNWDRVKQSECKPDHSAKVKNDWICTRFE